MQSHNLIPSYRLEARRRRRRFEAWVVGVSAYAAILAAVYVGFLCARGVDADALARRRQTTAARTAEVQSQIKAVQADLAEARRTLQANETLGGHPDWSLLLMLLAQNMNDGVVLRGCSLVPHQGETEGAEAAAPFPTSTPDDWRLQMQGFGKAVTAVSNFALAIEQTGLFEQVRLLKTVRQPFLAGQATHFQIVCDLGADHKETP